MLTFVLAVTGVLAFSVLALAILTYYWNKDMKQLRDEGFYD